MQLPIYIKKTGRSINVDTLAMVGESNVATFDRILETCKPVAYALAYGLTQSVNDAHAAIALTEGVDKVMSAAEKKLAAILAGTVKVRGASRTHADPIMHEALKIARAWWKGKGDGAQNAAIGKIRAKGGKFDDMEDSAIADIIINAFANTESTQDKAKAIVAANATKVDDDFDLDEIMADEDESDEDNE
jgi:hypothetical protein